MKEEMQKQFKIDLNNVLEEYGYTPTAYMFEEDEENLAVTVVGMNMKKNSKLEDRKERIYAQLNSAVMEIIASEYFRDDYDSSELDELDELVQEMICKFLAEM